jgi:hypothetical protein
MAELSSGQPVSWKESRSDNAATFEKIQELLKSKDDTSKFVGLALLKSVLDNGQLSQDQELLRTLWESISPKFIDRLLHSRPSDKVTKAEAQNMVDLAVAVLHTFAVLLPQDCQKDARLVGRTSPLVKALVERSGPHNSSVDLWTNTLQLPGNDKTHPANSHDHRQPA